MRILGLSMLAACNGGVHTWRDGSETCPVVAVDEAPTLGTTLSDGTTVGARCEALEGTFVLDLPDGSEESWAITVVGLDDGLPRQVLAYDADCSEGPLVTVGLRMAVLHQGETHDRRGQIFDSGRTSDEPGNPAQFQFVDLDGLLSASAATQLGEEAAALELDVLEQELWFRESTTRVPVRRLAP